jgi:ligand-binding sensor domain-containing protein
MIKTKTLFILVLLLLIVAHRGQATSLYTKVYKPGYAIDNKTIICAAEDLSGLLHFGTKGAVYQFDGMQYVAIALPDSLQQETVNSLLFVDQGFYAGLSGGQLLFFNNQVPSPAPKFVFQLHYPINQMLADNKNRQWIATYGGGIFVSHNNQLVHQFNTKNTLPDDFIYSLQSDNSGNVWAGSDAGLLCIEFVHDRPQISQYTKLPDLIITAIAAADSNQLWLGFQEGGFCSFDVQTTEVEHFPHIQGAVSQLLLDENTLWITTQKADLLAFDTGNKKLQQLKYSANEPENRIQQLAKSKLGGMWVVSPEKLIWTASHNIRFIETGTSDIQALLTDKNDNIWYASPQGLFHQPITQTAGAAKQQLVGTKFENAFITSLFEAADGILWLGTFDDGLLKYNPKTLQIKQFTENDGLANNNVLSIKGTGNHLWIATLGGVSRMLTGQEKPHFESFDQKDGLGNNYIFHIFIDSKHRVWFATDGDGISYFQNERFHSPDLASLAVKSIYSITEDQEGNIWFAASDDGIYKFDGHNLSHININKGLSSMTVTALQNTNGPFLIAVTDKGIDLIHSTTMEVYRLSERYQLGTYESHLNAIFAGKQGDFFIGTPYGIQIIHNLKKLGHRFPLLKINHIRSYMQPLPLQDNFTLAAQQDQISIDYSALWYPDPEQLRFDFQLKGYDLNQLVTRDHQLHYNGLHPGHYTLTIQAANQPSYAEKNRLTLEFKLLSPLWTRWYIWFPASILILLFIVWLIRRRMQKIRHEQQLKKEKIEFEYRNLRNQVNPHFLFNSFSTLMALIDTDPKEATNYVEQLSDYFRHILQFRDTPLIGLLEELNLLKNYVQLQKKRYGNGFDLQIELAATQLETLIPPMSLQMLVENALKHNVASQSKPLQIRIAANETHLIFSNPLQLKQTKEKSTGIGLTNIAERYSHFAAKKLQIEQTATEFIVKLPLITEK